MERQIQRSEVLCIAEKSLAILGIGAVLVNWTNDNETRMYKK